MADLGSQAAVLTDINSKVTTNGANENTGARVNQCLDNIVDTVYGAIAAVDSARVADKSELEADIDAETTARIAADALKVNTEAIALVYKATVQIADPPTTADVVNTLADQTPTWTYDNTGTVILTMTASFTVNKTNVMVSLAEADNHGFIRGYRVDADTVRVFTADTGNTPADYRFNIKIEVEQ